MALGTVGGRGSVVSSFTYAPPSSSEFSFPDFGAGRRNGEAGGISAWLRAHSAEEEASLILAWFTLVPHDTSGPC